MSSFKDSENLQKKEGGPDRSVSDKGLYFKTDLGQCLRDSESMSLRLIVHGSVNLNTITYSFIDIQIHLS